jgi:hypothetical protein
MQVNRVIGGAAVSIELTETELFAAYEEQQRLFDIESVRGKFDFMADTDLLEAYGMTYEQLDLLVEEMAGDLRHNLHKEMSWEYALSEAIKATISRHKLSSG